MNFINALLSHDDHLPMLKGPDDTKWRTYGEVLRRAERRAGFLYHNLGIRKESTVSIQGERSPDLFELHLACTVLGTKRAPIHPKKTAYEAHKLVRLTEPELIITCNPGDFAETGIKVVTELGTDRPITDWAQDQFASWLFTSG